MNRAISPYYEKKKRKKKVTHDETPSPSLVGVNTGEDRWGSRTTCEDNCMIAMTPAGNTRDENSDVKAIPVDKCCQHVTHLRVVRCPLYNTCRWSKRFACLFASLVSNIRVSWVHSVQTTVSSLSTVSSHCTVYSTVYSVLSKYSVQSVFPLYTVLWVYRLQSIYTEVTMYIYIQVPLSCSKDVKREFIMQIRRGESGYSRTSAWWSWSGSPTGNTKPIKLCTNL